MITDARVLDPTFVPAETQHRDAELNTLSAALNPITRGEPAETALLFGPSGVGKTCIAKFAVDQLNDTVANFNHAYINCWQNYSRFQTLYRVLEGIGQSLDIHRESTPTDKLLDRLRDYDGPPYVIILDEVDQHEDTSVLYDLYRVREVSMVLIANREVELFTQLDDRVASRLTAAMRIHFDRYGVAELVSILEDRVRWGLREDAITTDQLERIADAAAGDARVAISTLRTAARNAVEQGRNQITDALIEEAEPKAMAEIQQKTVQKLTEHQRLVYDIINDYGEIEPGELYAEYRDQADNPRTERTIRNYLRKLCHYNLVQAEGEGRRRVYRIIS
ncbi:orc1/cdc6 family replication initiation protein [Halorussus limi]|uniref:Orc1/cdc6 family replication initiation protein n=1 Tax=Halorussus limi TaxID=2938695 RepID=A0A8U0HQ01_9EURY|nr:Cdc6/Cdc18 family protein [Halorussus limi]UPV72941.1 orc1/cdc6 family replication initiation protein [Halorussus limi]